MTDPIVDYQVLVPLNPGTGSRALLALRRSGDQRTPIVLLPIPQDVLDDPESMSRLEKETARAAILEHPGILRVYGLVETSIGLCRAAEYAHGETLRAILNRVGHMPPGIAVRLMCEVAAGVHYAHLAGNEDGSPLVHGDLRPETIMLSLDGTARVSGYGALTVAPREPTGGRRVVGRRKYVAPEQVLGGRSSMAPTTDVFLLAITLYEMITGEIPFQEMDNPEDAVLEKPLPLDRQEIPEQLRAVLAKATAKRSRERYATAIDLRLALEEAMGEGLASDEEAQNWIVALLANDQRYAELSAAITQALEAPESVSAYVRVPSIPPQPIAPNAASADPVPAAMPEAQPTPPATSPAESAATPVIQPAPVVSAPPQTVAPSSPPSVVTPVSAPPSPAAETPQAPVHTPTQTPVQSLAPVPAQVQVQSQPPVPAPAAPSPEALALSRLPTQPPMSAVSTPISQAPMPAAAQPTLSQQSNASQALLVWGGAALVIFVAFGAFYFGSHSRGVEPAVAPIATEAAVSGAQAGDSAETPGVDGVSGTHEGDAHPDAPALSEHEFDHHEEDLAADAKKPRKKRRLAKGKPARRAAVQERAHERQTAPQERPVATADRQSAAAQPAPTVDSPRDEPPVEAKATRASAQPTRNDDDDLEAELEAALVSGSAMERQPVSEEGRRRLEQRRHERIAESTEAKEDAPMLRLFTIPPVTARIKGGKTLGRTPFTIPMDPGTYTVELIDREQRVNTERVIAVGGRGVSRIDITLGIGGIHVTAPDGASIIIDGRRWGVAPITNKIELYEGRHTLRVKTDSEDWERTFDLNADDMLNFNFGSGSYVR